VAGILWHVRRGTPILPVAAGAVVLPHALYVASVGGDHFEYRPLDLYFPFAFLLIAAGAMSWARSRRSSALTVLALAVLVLLAGELPWRSHVQFPARYVSGFPGGILAYGPDSMPKALVADEARDFLDPDRAWLYRLPGLRTLAAAHRDLVREGTEHFVGIRQEEHRLFLGTVVGEGRRLAALVAERRIPAGTHVALDCVGAIPFYSDLRTLDRLGLTDARVARQEFVHPETMAHGKYATAEYAREREVELWAIDNVHLLWDVRDPTFLETIVTLHANGEPAYFARIDEVTLLGALLPTGPRAVAASMSGLEFESVADPGVAARLTRLAIPSFRAAVQAHPELADGHSFLGLALILTGDLPEAEVELEAALALDPHNDAANNNLASLLVARGELREALPHLERSVRRDPRNARLRVNLGKVLLGLGQPERALLELEQALARDPDDAVARSAAERARQQLRRE
jgi:tetratricopeptide (TPR) repeat protein